MPKEPRFVLCLACLGLLLAGCASTITTGQESGSAFSTTPAGSRAVSKELAVFAAASLTDPFNEIGSAFSAKAGIAKITYNFGGSNTLRAQIEQGAPADVFAAANETEMGVLAKDGLLASVPAVFAANRLIVITPRSNPGRIEKPRDMARGGLKIVAAGPNVPVGGYMLQMLDRMSADPAYGAGFKDSVMRNVISQETDVKQVVAKVQLGEGDAGIVYSTDVSSKVAPDLAILDVPDPFNVVAHYPIAAIKTDAGEDFARQYVEYVLSDEGQAILHEHSFMPPR